MLSNNDITYYHKGMDKDRLTTWTKYGFTDVWVFGGKGSSINVGYENANDVNVRISMDKVSDATIFAIGDIICIGTQENITKQSDLEGKEYYNVTSININNFGSTPHVHLGGK